MIFRVQFRVKLFGVIHGKMAGWILYAGDWHGKKAFLCRHLGQSFHAMNTITLPNHWRDFCGDLTVAAIKTAVAV